MRLPAQLDIGPYTIHLDVLATRLLRQRQRIRRWSLALFSGAVTLLTMGVLAWGLIPWLHGTGTVVFASYPDDATLSLDGQSLALSVDQVTVRAGEHTVEARRPGAFPVTLPLSVTRNQTVTLTLPPLRPIPIVQAVALPASDATWQQVGSDAGGGWRITARAPLTAAAQPGWGPTATEATTRYVLHLDAAGLTRQSVLETYPIADEIVTPRGERYWAAWEPTQQSMAPDVTGLLELTTPAGTRTISTTETLRGLWWAPDGRELLLAQANAQGQNLVLVAPQRVGREPGPALITVPGVIQSVQWSPDGQAAVVLSAAEPAPAGRPIPSAATATPTPTQSEAATTIPTRSAVLIWRNAGGAVAATRLRAPPDRAGGVALLAWSPGQLWWGTDTGLGLALDRIDLATGSVTRVGALPADLVALTVTADERVHVIRRLPDGALSVQRWPNAEPLFTIPELQLPAPAARPAGVWLGQELILVAGPTELWYVRIDPEALQ